MADSPRSSFIPKQSSGGVSPTVKRRRKFNVLNFIASITLVGSLILAVGTFFYKDYSAKQLVEEKAALEAERNRFSESDIVAVREFDRRLMAAEYLLDQHLAPSKIFDSLELNTKETIQFGTLSYEREGTGGVELTLGGLTETFASVALQAIEFEDDAVMGTASFTGLSTSDSLDRPQEAAPQGGEDVPRVGFSVAGTVTASSIAFDGRLTQNRPEETQADESAEPEPAAVTEESSDEQ